MNKYIIAEVTTDDQIIHRGELLLDQDVLVVGSGSTSDVYAVYEHQISSLYLTHASDDADIATRYVAKLWRELPIHEEQVRKLRYMVRNKITYKTQQGIVWPEYLLLRNTDTTDEASVYDDIPYTNDMVIGYIMPRILGAFPLYKLIDPTERGSLPFEYKDMRFLYHISCNLARAFYALHQQHHVMGDANPTNMLVTPSGEINLIDCDSFQIQRNQSEYYPANKQSSSNKFLIDISASNDLVNLAILIFQLLMQGAHPFVGYNSSSELIDSTSLRSQRIFTFMHPAYTPLGVTPPIECLPDEIQQLCLTAFTNQPQMPPSAVVWVKTLKLQATQLDACENNPLHYHIAGLPCAECEWQKRQSGLLQQGDVQ
jgi:DNA-binding helix-hairpin-helix protein with protein kinase domain